MSISQNDLEKINDRLDRGEIDVDTANVEIVKCQRIKLITAKVPSSVRKALNKAVRRGELGHMKKDGYLPEVYYHPKFEYLVAGERNGYVEKTIRNITTAYSEILT